MWFSLLCSSLFSVLDILHFAVLSDEISYTFLAQTSLSQSVRILFYFIMGVIVEPMRNALLQKHGESGHKITLGPAISFGTQKRSSVKAAPPLLCFKHRLLPGYHAGRCTRGVHMCIGASRQEAYTSPVTTPHSGYHWDGTNRRCE